MRGVVRRDNHHILNIASQWESTSAAKSLRQEPSLQVRLDREQHELIHRECPPIPLLGHHALMQVRRDFEPHHNHQKAIDSLLRSIEKAGQHPKAHVLETSLAQLAIWSIEEQIPYLELRRYH